MAKIPTRYVLGCLALAASYSLIALWTLSFLAPTGMASPLWPPAGLALGALLLGGARYWPGIVLGQLIGNGVLTGVWGMALGFGLGNALAALAGLYLVQRWQHSATLGLNAPRDFFVLMAAAALSAAVASLLGNITHALSAGQPPQWDSLVNWWQGDLLGMLVITPLMLAIGKKPQQPWTAARFFEAALLLGLTVTVSLESAPARMLDFARHEQESLLFLLVLWAALRFGLQGVLATICTTGLLLLWQYSRLMPTLTEPLKDATLHHIWMLLFVLTVVGVTLTLKVKILSTEKKLVLEALEAEENANDMFRQAQSQAHIGHWEHDIETGEVKWSEEIFRLFEIDSAMFAASYEGFLAAIHPDDRDPVNQAYLDSVKNHTPYEITHRLRMRDGRIKWVIERGETRYDAHGKPLRSVGTVQDFTERKHQEDAALIANEARLRAIFNTVTDGIVITDANGIIEMVNPSTERMFGYSASELIGQNISMLMPERDAHHHDQHMHAYRKREVSKVIGIGRELAGLHHSGKEFSIEITISQTTFGDRVMFVGVIRDISERKRVEAALREAKTQAEAANLAKSQFMATMTHELRTPLNSLLGMQQVVLMDTITDRQRECLENGQRAGQHLLDMINNILDYTKIEAGKIELHPTDIDLREVLHNVITLMQPHTDGKTLQLGLFIDNNVPHSIRADALRLKQVMINLLQNAVKFTPEGEVNLRVSDIAQENGECKLRFEIQDTGIGIAREDQHSLFELFHQVDNSITRRFGGTGLGLAICKQLVREMGGHIGVESEPGQGSTFWFEIPCHALRRATQDALATTPRPQNLRPLHGVRIVLFETDPNQQRAVSRILLGRGAMVAIATTPAELQQHLSQSTCKLVLMGLSAELPLSDLVGLVPGNLPLILLQPVGADSPDAPGISARLTKPVTAETLLRTIERILN